MYPALLDDDLIIRPNTNKVSFTNSNAGKVITIYLPAATSGKRYRFIQLDSHDLIVDTNRPQTTFLWETQPTRLILPGNPSDFGRHVLIESFNDNWLIVNSTFDHLPIKELQCLDTPMTN